MFSIYLITDSQTQKVYVGQTSQDPPELRWRNHIHRCNSGERKHLYEAMRYRGIDVFDFSLIETCETQEQANDAERRWIAHYDSMRAGYNRTEGGEGRVLSPAVIERLREINNGSNNPMHGKRHTSEALAKISAASRERFARGEHPALGTQHTDEHKRKIGQASKMRWSNPAYKERLGQKGKERWEAFRSSPERRELIAEIQRRLACGETGKSIAKELNVSPSFVSSINRGHVS